VRSGVLGGALVQVPGGVKEVQYEIRPHKKELAVITQEMVKALRERPARDSAVCSQP
jgi:hypothetical protein